MRLASADRPDVLCLQEIPAWALRRLGEWSGMTAFGVLAQPPRIGPFPSTIELGRRLTALHNGLLRSAFAGQGNAILVAGELRAGEHRTLALNPRSFRREVGRRLGLDLVLRLAWGRERRVCQALRVVLADGRTALVANLHATGSRDKRIPDAEVLRAADFAEGRARADEICVLAGDFNAAVGRSRALTELVERGFSAAGDGIDHVLVRGAESSPALRWPRASRTVADRVLSDHAPVDVRIE